MPTIDLNIDVGECVGDDRALIAAATSANIACGAHAGDATTMDAAVRAAIEYDVAIGAHPGHADRKDFGRRELPITPDALRRLVTQQIDMLAEVAERHGAKIAYLKLHGALYHQAGRDATLAAAVAQAAADHAGAIAILGREASQLDAAAHAAGVPFYREAFADRAYLPDGTLAPRGSPGAVRDDPDAIVRQAEQIAMHREVECQDGSRRLIRGHSLCLHGDGPQAAEVAHKVRQALTASGVIFRPFVGMRGV